MQRRFTACIAASLTAIILLLGSAHAGESEPGPSERCPVCGMFVAKYLSWVARLDFGGDSYFFDGVKDMLAFRFEPGKYKAKGSPTGVWVKDYYTLEWIDGATAFYVEGSDVYGPMGHELVPFSTREAAENFLNDHHGKQILRDEEITRELVEKLRHGQRMR